MEISVNVIMLLGDSFVLMLLKILEWKAWNSKEMNVMSWVNLLGKEQNALKLLFAKLIIQWEVP